MEYNGRKNIHNITHGIYRDMSLRIKQCDDNICDISLVLGELNNFIESFSRLDSVNNVQFFSFSNYELLKHLIGIAFHLSISSFSPCHQLSKIN